MSSQNLITKNPTNLKVIETVFEYPVADLVVDEAWNSRPPGELDTGGELEESEISSLADSIRENGQDTPVVVRPLEDGRLFLCSGFRRYRAIRLLELPTIRCVLREYDDSAARAHNLRENVSRRQIPPAALARGLWQLRKITGDSARALAAQVGIGKQYAKNLLDIEERCTPEILDAWHKNPISISVMRMLEVSKLPRDKQEAAFSRSSRPLTKKSFKKSIWGAEKEARSVGHALGKLYQAAIIPEVDFRQHFGLCVKLPEDATEEQLRAVISALEDGFLKALD